MEIKKIQTPKTLGLFFLILAFLPVSGKSQNLYNENLKHAETYYWLGIQDKGDPAAFEKALQYLNQAELQLKTSDSTLDSEDVASLQQQIALLRTDLDEQLKIARNTFIGRYPLARFMGQSPFVSSKTFGSFEIFEEPGKVAMARSAEKLGGLFYNHFSDDLQLPVIVFSQDNLSPDLESKVRIILKTSPRIKVYQTQYLKKYLIEDELIRLQLGAPDSIVIAKLSKIMKTETFGITTIRLIDKVNDVNFYSLNNQVFSTKSETPIQSTVLYELVRDKRKLNLLYLLSILALFSLAIVVYIINFRINTGKYPCFRKIAGIITLAFFIGFMTTIVALGIFYNLRPDYLDFFAYTFWWIPAAMLIIFIAPLFIIKKYILILPVFQSAENTSSRMSPLFLTASLGVLAYLSHGLILYHGYTGLLFISAGALSMGISAFIAGKVLNTIKPISAVFGVLAVLIIPITGLALASHNLYYMLFPVLGSTSLIWASQLKLAKTKGITITKFNEAKKGINIQQFINLTENPPYIKTESYEAAKAKADLHTEEQPVILCLTGDEGTGKTAMAHQLIAEFRTQNKEQNKPFLLLDAQCPEKNDSPYFPVQNALAEFINFMASDSSGLQGMEDIENALDELVGSFVPFSSLLKSANKTKAAGINSQSELFYIITKTLEKLSHQYQLVFFIDDLQWADNATLDLLNCIHRRFRNSTSKKALFLYTSRPSDACSFLFQEHEVQTLEVLSYKEKFALLTKSMGMESEAAGFVLDCLGDKNRKGNLFLMYKILEQLAREAHLNENTKGITLAQEILQSGKLPIPDEYMETLRHELSKLGQYEEYIAVAACMGMEFEVGILAQSLGDDRLKCLKVLQYLEKETSILYDKHEKDDVFSFSSSFTLETIREILALTDEGPNELVKQIVREYHARIATSLEQKDAEGNVLRIASHYYAAGQNFAETAMHFLIKAADNCAEIFRFDEARSFLQKAGIEKNYNKDASMYELEIILVECKISMLEGKHFIPAAEKCEEFHQNHPETPASHQLVFARTYYYAHWFKKAETLCRSILEHDLDELLQARAYHLLAISLDPKFSEERMKNLQTALKIMGSIENPNTEHLKALGEIHNSMGEEYTKHCKEKPEYKKIAKNHFFESIRLKSLREVNDTPGLARAYGGLGRIELYIKPVNLNTALDYFQKDLELSVQIGDILGQAQMHSNMGKCYILLGHYEKALPAYQESYELAERTTDKAFALLGQLMVYEHTDWNVGADESLKNLEMIIKQEKSALPVFLINEMIGFFEGSKKREMFSALLEELKQQ